MNSRILLAIGVVLLTSIVQMAAQPGSTAEPTAVRASFGKLPLYFVENRGVYPDEVRYYIQGADKTLFFTDQGVTIALRGKEKGWTVKLNFVGANKDVPPEGLDKQEAVFSYFKGPEKDWKAGLRTYSKVVYRDLWPGIDLVYNGTVNTLKYEFVVAPGADPAMIQLQYRGASSVAATEAGALKVETPEGSFEDAPPLAWQEINGKRVAVSMAYALGENGAFGFEIGEYDPEHPLVLDPAVIVYCGYIGGAGDESGWAVAVDAAGNAFVAGETTSSQQTFPVRVGPDLTYNGGSPDAFVAKVNAAGTGLLYCGYIGGFGNDHAQGVAVDATGSAYLTGYTSSDARTFPLRVGPDFTHNGGMDAFVAKVNPQGTSLVYCGYIGGSGNDYAWHVAVDAAGSAYVTGETSSDEKTFPVKVGPDLTYNGGSSDAFVAKVSANATTLSYCGYIGGSGDDYGYGIAVDSVGQAHLTGETWSGPQSFPVWVGPDLTHNGAMDGFVAKLNAQGTALIYCGYIGGSGMDYGAAIAVDSAGDAHVTGETGSSQQTFFVVRGPDLTYNGGMIDAFVCKIDSTGTRWLYCGYIGGSGDDRGYGITVDSLNRAVVVGETRSSQQTFPVVGGPSLTHGGGDDAFLAVLSAQGSTLLSCGYTGGSGRDYGAGVAVDRAGNVYVTGGTQSGQQTFPVVGGPALIFNGGPRDAFLAKVSVTLLQGSNPLPRRGTTLLFTLSASGDAGLPYVMGCSFSTGPIRIGARALRLGLDQLLINSVANAWPTMFVGFQGVIGANARAAAHFNIPNNPAFRGMRMHAAFVTLSSTAPFGIRSISNTYSFTIQ